MGDDNKKSFWTSMPGILTGVAAVIVAVGGVLATYYHVTPPPSPPSPPPSQSSASSTQPSTPPSSSQQVACGTQLPGVTLFGIWRWSGTNHDVTQSGVFTFNNDCTYAETISGYTTNNEGYYVVSSSSSSAAPSITLTGKGSGEKNTYLINNISKNFFHMSSPDNTVNLDFVKAS